MAAKGRKNDSSKKRSRIFDHGFHGQHGSGRRLQGVLSVIIGVIRGWRFRCRTSGFTSSMNSCLVQTWQEVVVGEGVNRRGWTDAEMRPDF